VQKRCKQANTKQFQVQSELSNNHPETVKRPIPSLFQQKSHPFLDDFIVSNMAFDGGGGEGTLVPLLPMALTMS